MEPLDLTKAPPRSPKERLDGLLMMPRTIDKMRASLPGGNIGEYKIPGYSARMMEMLGVKEDPLLEEVRRASSEAEIAAWVRSHADPATYDEVNRYLEGLTFDGVKDKDAFDLRYPARKRLGLTRMLDVLDADDLETFA